MAQSFIVKSKIENFSKNTIVDEKDVLARIKDWEFQDNDPTLETIVVEYEILSGLRKGITLKDFVTFDPENKMNWKYASLRAALGVPIPNKGEDNYDILNMVGKFLVVNLVKSKDGGKYQNLTYVVASDDKLEQLIEKNVGSIEEPEEEPVSQPAKPQATQPATTKAVTKGLDVPAVGEDDLPF